MQWENRSFNMKKKWDDLDLLNVKQTFRIGLTSLSSIHKGPLLKHSLGNLSIKHATFSCYLNTSLVTNTYVTRSS